MKRVLVITYYWPPSGGAGVQRWLKFVKYLPAFGWEPVVVTVRPEDASYAIIDQTFTGEIPGNVRVIRTPSREVFRLYRKVFRKKDLPTGGFANSETPSFTEKVSRFIRGNFFIPDPRRGWNRYAFRAASELLENETFHCIVTSSPPHSSQLIGRKLHRKFGLPWLADMRDPWTDIYYFNKLYPTPIARLIHRSYERKTLKQADVVITVGPTLRQLLERKFSLPEETVRVVSNGYDEEDFRKLPRPEKQSHVITYVGTLSDQYPISGLIGAVKSVREDHPGILLRFVGSVPVHQRRQLEQLPGNLVEYISHVSHARALEYMMQSGILLLVIPRHASGKAIVTGKVFEYLASGTPVMGIGPTDGDSAGIIRETQRGAFFEYGDAAGMASFMRGQMEGGVTSEKLPPATLRYTRKALTGKLVRVMEDAASR